MILVTLGHDSKSAAEVWAAAGLVKRIINFRHASPSGYRLRNRILGIGLDSFIVALKATITSQGSTFLAANPWPGVALRLLGQRVYVTGLYAMPGSRSWEVLRRGLRDSPVITLSEPEIVAWRASGGTGRAVRYGNTFEYPLRKPAFDREIRVFVGGTSDRDMRTLAATIENAHSAGLPITFVLAMGREPARFLRPNWASRVETHPSLSQQEFGRVLAACDVVYLPLTERSRAAGHMVAVGAIESGVPVVATDVSGMHDYLDGTYLRSALSGQELLAQLMEVAQWGRTEVQSVHDYWQRHFSQESYISRVSSALAEMSR
ncbi:glycosyltransferase [Nocardioides pacificus]